MEPLYPNPGGVVDPDDLVGRTTELQQLHESLAHGGAHVTGERRMGKTSVLAKLEAELGAAGRTVVRVSAETSDTKVFEQRLLTALRENHAIRERIHHWEKEVHGSIGLAVGQTGLKLTATAKRPAEEPKQWDVLELLSSVRDPRGAVLIIDEVTVLCKALGRDPAVEFLRGLRAERQGRGAIPLVLSGSIGLHHALGSTEPINDLWRVDIGPLTEPEARELTTRLLIGIQAPYDDRLVAEVVRETSAIPFYIQAVVDQLRNHPGRSVPDIIERCIADNIWHTRHYAGRVEDYYGADAAPLARAILDEMALANPHGLDFDGLRSRVTAILETPPSRDALIDILTKLEADHYLVRDGNLDRMSSPLLAKIWRIHRRLG